MTLPTLPSYLKVTDARLRISNAADEHKSEINRRNPSPAAFREVWTLEAAFAPIARGYADALAAWIEALDGRVNAFKMPLTQGVYGATCTATVALSGNTARGAGYLPVTITGTIPAGTLLGVGDIEASAFQVFEVLEDATSVTTQLPIAPRVRHAFTTSSPVEVSAVHGRFNLFADATGGVSLTLDRAGVALSAVEAL